MKRFTVEGVTTWGLVKDEKYGGYKLPVSLTNEPSIVNQIQKIADKQEVKSPFYSGEYKTIYFKLFELSKKQRETLLDQDRRTIDLSFVIEDVPYTTEEGKKYLRTRVIALKRSVSDQSQAPSDDI